MSQIKFPIWPFYLLAVIVIVLDQATKLWVDAALEYREVIPVVPFFNITLAYNSGAAFSFLADQTGWQRWFLSILAAAVSVMLVVWIKKLPPAERNLGYPLGLILGGAIGNLIDRLAYGHVIDFLDIYINDTTPHWPAFNIADSAICVGAVYLLWVTFRQSKAV